MLALIIVAAALTGCDSQQTAHTDDMIFFDGFNAFAPKSALNIEFQQYAGQLAMKVTLSLGQGNFKHIGILFKEKATAENAGKYLTAIGKLADILNDPKRNILHGNKELSADIGLTFQNYVSVDGLKDLD